MELADENPSRISALVFQPDSHLRPRRLQRKTLRPFQNHDRRFGKHIFQAQRLKIVEAFDAVQIGVVNLRGFSVHMNEA